MSNHSTAQEIQAEIQAIRNQYKERLAADKSKLLSFLDELNVNSAHQAAHEIHLILHSISGSAGTFGFSQISSEARRIDRSLKQSVNQPNTQNSNSLTNFINDELTHFCHLLDKVNSDDELKIEQLENTEKTSQRIITSRPEGEREVWLIEENEKLADQFSRQLVNFNFKINTMNLKQALDLASKLGWPNATIIDIDCDDFKDPPSTNNVFSYLKEATEGLIMLSENDSFEQRIKAAKARATSFLKKPVDLSELISHLEAILNEERVSPPRVMLVDDDKELCALLKVELESEGMQVNILNNIKSILSELVEFKPELLMLDMEMPSYSGIDIALLVRQHAQFESLPIVYLSAEQDIDKQTEALLLDADDFLVKPISHKRLVSSIRSRVQRARTLEQLISKDGLTGLLKHSTIKEHATREFERSRREGSPVSIIMLDIDHFKRVNDTHGHATGDDVIASLAALLRNRFRKTDILGRYGGEEFMIILPNTGASQAFDIMEGIRVAFSKMEFTSNNQTFFCTLSAGCVCSDDFAQNTDASDLIEEADKALYISKNGGRNRVSRKQ
ncbi:diguanylate cyclase [Idiomarina sp.]|uniref:diguanylate cyclase n=1 Tax=Idiomarina sp. TaxID=1874361 RepID=UPI003A8F0EC9